MQTLKGKIEAANLEAVTRMVKAQPMWNDVCAAGEGIPGMTKSTFLHAGPPISWERMCIPQKNAMIGAIMYEGLAGTPEEALKLIEQGKVTMSPSHPYNTVTSMAGITSYSQPVFVVVNEQTGHKGFCAFYEGPEYDILKMGVYSERVLKNLKYIETVTGPALQKAIRRHGPLNVKRLLAKALTMGDEIHTRNVAATHLMAMEMAGDMLRAGVDREEAAQTMELMQRSDQFTIHLSMAACKVMADAARNVEYSTMVTALARNGVDVGVQVSGLGDAWFVGPAQLWTGALWFGAYSNADANPDTGDSAIVECVGLGGMATAAAPVLIQMKGGTVQDAVDYTRQMDDICIMQHPDFTIPMLDGQGTPTGIDIRKVVATGNVPVINSSICHKNGLGQIGVGHALAPMEAFEHALRAFGEKYAE